MIRRALSITLTLVLVALCAHLVQRSVELGRLQKRVASLDKQFGSLNRFDPGKFWVKLIENRPDNYGWRIHIPAVDEIYQWETSINSNGDVYYTKQDSINVREYQLDQETNFWLRGYVHNGETHENKFLGKYQVMRSWNEVRVAFLLADFYPYKDLARESFEFKLFGEAQTAHDIDEAIPLYSLRLTPAAIGALVESKRIDEKTAQRLAVPRTYFIGTAQAYARMTGDDK